MEKARGLLIFFLLFTVTSWAEESSFELALPELESSSPSSSNFVSSFEKEPGNNFSNEPYESSTSAQTSAEPVKGVYENAFTSYQSKKTAEEENTATDEWRKGLDKQDNFDLENLTFSEPKTAPHPRGQARRPTVASATDVAEDKIPMPGLDNNQESSAPPVSAKDRKAAVMKTISDNYEELKVCYQEGLKKNSEMKGKVVLGWSMDTQGRVSGVEVLTSQLNNKQVEKCMAEHLANWHFPRQAKLRSSKDRMTYAFQFVSEKE
ncbi:MAG TPA: AgmX/PglI C-terminal domain-containing protein [Pseudobdellovibrionaceae bacterium]